jgi:hypothetical protein
VNLEDFEDGVPAVFECLYTLTKLGVLVLTGRLDGTMLVCVTEGSEAHTGAEGTVLSLELVDALLEGVKLGLAAIARVLCCDSVAMCAGFFALIGGEAIAAAFARGLVDIVRCRM